LATTVLSALTVYASSVTDEGAEQVLAASSFADTGTRVGAFIGADQYQGSDRSIRDAVGHAYGDDIELQVYASGRSSSYARSAEVDAESPDLIGFGFYDGIEDFARLVGGGAWPGRSSDGRIEVALPAAAAEPLDLEIGSELEIANRVTKKPITVVVTGLFEPLDPSAPFWNNDQLVLTGRQQLGFRTFGPMVVSRQTFLDNLDDNASMLWLVDPDLDALKEIDFSGLATRIRELPGQLGADNSRTTISVSVRLADTLAQLERARLVARSTMLIPVLQLLVLAAYALLLTSRLLAEHRRTEHALLRARGAGTGQIAALGIKEGLLLATPAALFAPLLAPPVLEVIGRTTSAAEFDIPVPGVSGWAVSAAAAAICALALTLPSLREAATYVESQQERGRGRRRSAIQRAGADLALLVVAALAFVQLRHYGGPVVSVTDDSQAQTLGFDPLIAAGPALGLLAGGILALRLVPMLSRVTESATSRRTSLAPALGAWQVSRRPLRYAGPALLLVMATSIGVLSVVTIATWRQSQQDQADFQAGADLRVQLAASQPAASAGSWLADIPGVTAVAPALRSQVDIDDQRVELLALPAGTAPQLLRMRPDLLAGRSVADALDPLAAPHPVTVAARVPGQPVGLAAAVRLRPTEPDAAAPAPTAILRLLVRDGVGALFAVPLGELVADGNRHELR
ncbi:MAG: hypothetical protein L0Y54_21550, partial [Sporichthyaceae bacterium]|nr:hypothetical protein [Sporichthyaceae bacterium]